MKPIYTIKTTNGQYLRATMREATSADVADTLRAAAGLRQTRVVVAMKWAMAVIAVLIAVGLVTYLGQDRLVMLAAELVAR